ncbi:hypothetical protein KRR39_09610 [Nocardioides panacis]|uniref:Uncharacterized protein n=1 Tax=Nocardioides panacis TaxID=2849501 RepID=A0A975Y1W9_9ACTN|nr:hypothetical protein [Nocardioides panacis]QWZ09953.1 hypothetical protein KRR39_09610 [Nocardioides panacis]
MTTRTRILLDLVVRGGVLLAGHWAFTTLWDASTPGPHETDIGGGLLGLGLVVLAALVWGGLDGRRRDLARLTVTWVGAGLVTAAFAVVGLAVQGGERDEVLIAMAALAPFLTVLVAAPAVIAGSLSWGFAHRRHAHG